MTSPVLKWTHVAAEPLGVVVPRALELVAERGGAPDVATWRAFVLGVVAAMADLGSAPVAQAGADLVVSPRLSTSSDRATYQRALALALAALAAPREATTPPELAASVTLTTIGGGPASVARPGNVGAFPLLAAAAVVLVAGIVGAAVAYCAALDSELELRKLEADAKKNALAKLLAASAAAAEAHVDREERERATIPWSDAELGRLEALNLATRDVAGWRADPLSAVPDLRGGSQAAADALKSASSGLSWAFPVALLLGTFLLTKDR